MTLYIKMNKETLTFFFSHRVFEYQVNVCMEEYVNWVFKQIIDRYVLHIFPLKIFSDGIAKYIILVEFLQFNMVSKYFLLPIYIFISEIDTLYFCHCEE